MRTDSTSAPCSRQPRSLPQPGLNEEEEHRQWKVRQAHNTLCMLYSADSTLHALCGSHAQVLMQLCRTVSYTDVNATC